jgi:hypothetical protein
LFFHQFLRWARYLCSLTYAIRILLINEFEDCANEQSANEDEPNYCRQALDNVDADADETWWNWLVLVALFVVFRVMALRILQLKSTKFY